MSDEELINLFSEIKKRVHEVRYSSHKHESLLAHLRSLSRFEQGPMDYPEVIAEFPETIHIAYAVCHRECGSREFIVDGSTQECQACGSLMFRTEVQEFKRVSASNRVG